MVGLLLAFGIALGGLTVVDVATAQPAQALSLSQCRSLSQAAGSVAWRFGPHVGAFVFGACIGDAYGRSWWWNSNFDRIMNRCWPNCSPWDFTRMVLGIPG